MRVPSTKLIGSVRFGWQLVVACLLTTPLVMAADWPLSPVQRVSLSRGEILVDADVNFERNRGDVRAAVRIAAPASTIFAVMTDCAAALKFVPHLQRCVVLETGPDRSWELVEHVVDLSWYIPRTRYVFRADYDPGHSVSFHQVRGDLRANEGLWEFVPEDAGTATIVTYRVHIVPRYYVPRWLVRSSLKRELPALLESLRRYCESGAGVAAEGGAK